MEDKKLNRPQKISTKIRWAKIPIALLGIVLTYACINQLLEPVVNATEVCLHFYGLIICVSLFIYYGTYKRIAFDTRQIYITHQYKVSVVPLTAITKIKIRSLEKAPRIKPHEQYTWTVYYKEEGKIHKACFMARSLEHIEGLIKQTVAVNQRVDVSAYTVL